MKKPAALCATAVTLVLALTVAGAAVARTQATTINVTAAMTAAQEVPAPTGDVTVARGTFSATVTRSETGAVMTWQLSFSGLTGAAGAAHVHIAPRGQAGPVAVPLCGPCVSPASGTANIDASVVNALETGRAYANVHTAANAPGEIRGQIGVRASVNATLTAGQETPKPKGNVRRARGTFTATLTKSGTIGTITWRLTFSRLTGRALAAHIHRGARGKAGPVVVPLCGPCRSGARGTTTLQASVLNALEAGRTYVNVHTRRNPAGEIRGQLPAVALRITAS
jgi:CHRD domain